MHFNKFFLIFIVLVVMVGSSYAGQLMGLHGKVSLNGSLVNNGDLRVFIYSAPTAGIVIYDSGTDFSGRIVNGFFDVSLGSGSVSLDLNYGRVYYMDLSVNGNDLDFNGVDRKTFENNRGDINWTVLTNYPAPCASGFAIQAVGDTLTCVAVSSYGDANVNAIIASRMPILDANLSTLDWDKLFDYPTGCAVGEAVRVIGDTLTCVNVTSNGGDGNLSGLLTAPYVPRALDANHLVDSNIYIAANGDVGIKRVPAHALDVNGTTRSTKIFYPSANKVFVDSTDNLYYSDGATVLVTNGFGAQNLHYGSGSVLSDGAGFLYLGSAGSASIPALSLFNDPNTGIYGGSDIIRFTTAGVHKMSILSDGNVGIGTTTPKNKLQVIGDLNVNANVYFPTLPTSGGTNCLLIAANGSVSSETCPAGGSGQVTYAQFKQFFDGNLATQVPWADANVANNITIKSSNDANFYNGLTTNYIGSVDNNTLTLATNNATRATILTDGNVGIGTTTPTYKLDVNGNTRVTGDLNVLGTTYLGNTTLNTDTITVNNVRSRDGNITLRDADGNAEVTLVGSSGNVGIGTTTPLYKLHIHDTTIPYLNFTNDTSGVQGIDGFQLGMQSTGMEVLFIHRENAAMRFYTNGSERLAISNTGNVGVGIASPSYTLDVNGHLNVKTTAGTQVSFTIPSPSS